MVRKQHRRIRTEPVAGADPTPQAFPPEADVAPELATEDQLGSWGDDDELEVLPDAASADNGERLKADRPPHYA